MKYQDFFRDENLVSSEDTIFILHMWRYITVDMATSVLGKKKKAKKKKGRRAPQHLAVGVYMINRMLHARLWIRILSSSVQLDISLVRGAHSWDIELNTRR